MQTLGYLWLMDRQGNQTQCVQVLYRRGKDYTYVKRRKESKTLGVHFSGEQAYIQSQRFGNPAIGYSDEQAESDYQECIKQFLYHDGTIGC